MDYRIDHVINTAVRHHPLVVPIVTGFATWGVLVFGAAAVLLWFLANPESDMWKRAGTAGLAGAALGLATNQIIIQLWQRPRPYAAHPHGIVPLLARTTDPSFPSDHASAAFGIAVGVLLVHRRAGYAFVATALVIAVSRVATGMHYSTDVLAGAAIGSLSGLVAARVAMEPLLMPVISAFSVVSDPAVTFVRRLTVTQRTLLNPHFRAAVVGTVGLVLLARFTADLRSHLIDELPIASLTTWLAIVGAAIYLALQRYDDPPSCRHQPGRAGATDSRSPT